jgi:hypothetical protein
MLLPKIMNKPLLCCLLLFFPLVISAQVFEVIDTNVVIRNNQSPVHWYAELNNLVGVDTTLRWKVAFKDVPKEWVINFDDETQFYDSVQAGDSADFTLLWGLSIPQKLIIGISLNGTYGKTAVISFRLYDPNDAANATNVHFNIEVPPFHVGMANTQQGEKWWSQSQATINLDAALDNCSIYDLQGNLLFSKNTSRKGEKVDVAILPTAVYVLRLQKGKEVRVVQFLKR